MYFFLIWEGKSHQPRLAGCVILTETNLIELENLVKIVCISAANIEVARNHSASVRACQVVKDLFLAEQPSAEVEIVPLIDYDMKSCQMCGKCYPSQRCAVDAAFNQVFEKLISADGIFLVVPHYAPLPSKLMILMEKMQEISYLHWCGNSDYRFPMTDKPVGIIGHGGQESNPETRAYYKRMLVEPMAMAFRSISMQVIGGGEDCRNGVSFGIRSLTKRPDSIFVDIEYDWDEVRQRVTPLVRNLAAALA